MRPPAALPEPAGVDALFAHAARRIAAASPPRAAPTPARPLAVPAREAEERYAELHRLGEADRISDGFCDVTDAIVVDRGTDETLELVIAKATAFAPPPNLGSQRAASNREVAANKSSPSCIAPLRGPPRVGRRALFCHHGAAP